LCLSKLLDLREVSNYLETLDLRDSLSGEMAIYCIY